MNYELLFFTDDCTTEAMSCMDGVDALNVDISSLNSTDNHNFCQISLNSTDNHNFCQYVRTQIYSIIILLI